MTFKEAYFAAGCPLLHPFRVAPWNISITFFYLSITFTLIITNYVVASKALIPSSNLQRFNLYITI